jgi:quercetin dioxygenase-like cupin family protein
MNRTIVFPATLLLFIFSHLAIAQQVTEPEMTAHRLNDMEVRNQSDGRSQRRVDAATVSLIRVEWPEGTVTTPHNHANELVMMLVEGRLRAISEGKEIILEAGDVVVFPAWAEHSYVALEDSITIEAAGPGS